MDHAQGLAVASLSLRRKWLLLFLFMVGVMGIGLARVTSADQTAIPATGLLCISDCATCPVICSPPPPPLESKPPRSPPAVHHSPPQSYYFQSPPPPPPPPPSYISWGATPPPPPDYTTVPSGQDNSNALSVTLGIAAATGLGLFAFSEVETILQVLGSATFVQLISKNLLFAQGMVPAFSTSCCNLINRWKKLPTPHELDIMADLHNFSGDVIARTTFGSSDEEGKKIFELQKEQAVLVIKASPAIYIASLRKQVDNEMTIEDLIEECKLFYFAGQETTANWLTWTIIILSMNPNWQDRAREEVLQMCGKRIPDLETIKHLKIVSMVLHKVLRLYPPVTALF
ncbi:hypothetical protein F0562_003025 [Nyssa sinensis]|uniref:Uncharacterized protein n=1 Tax=Nyssa sinensis TaxID=561372 RepID=A0A5J5BU66_9ASTE|nr:hypothetical protein F0562_003025 [Nyssa sinensis]